MVRAVVVGTGDMAHGLAHIFKNNNTGTNTMEVTKPGLKSNGNFHDTGVPIVAMDEALLRADIVILAIPADSLQTFIASNPVLNGKILVDATNSNVPGQNLASIVATNNVKWVKAFNDVGAGDALLNKAVQKTGLATKMCGPDLDSVSQVKQFAEDSFGMRVKVVPYEHYDDVESSQGSLGEQFVTAAKVMISVFVITEFYAILRYNVYEEVPWNQLLLKVTNKAFCWTALTGFALTQVPGTIARMMNVIQTDSLHNKPLWLLKFLGFRKHLGILSVWFLFVHIMMSMLIFTPTYYAKLFSEDGTQLSGMGVYSLFFAIMGTSFYAIMTVCTLPSVAAGMTNKSWQFVYGPLAWTALACGMAHVLIQGVPGWFTPGKWPGSMPPITLMSTALPIVVVLMKVCQMIMSRTCSSKKLYTSTENDRAVPLV